MELNLENTVLVRAYKNYIPYSKIIRPSCEEKYLNYDSTSDYRSIIQKEFIKEYQKQTGKTLNIWEEENYKIIDESIKNLLPLSSTYVSTLSFSINGLVHDDMNNFFSEYNVCIIEPLKYHTSDDFINFNVNDTTIKGSIELSSEAILVIKKEYYESLKEEEKAQLNSIYKINLFEGSLKEAVDTTLKDNNYPSLNLINKRELKYIEDSEEKQSALQFINKFAEDNKLSKLRLFDIYTSPFMELEEDKEAQSKLVDEIENINKIKIYYRNNFYDYLIKIAKDNGMELDEMSEYYLKSEYSNSIDVLEEIVKYILEKVGFNKYSKLINEYNKQLIENYKTNSEIIGNNNILKR